MHQWPWPLQVSLAGVTNKKCSRLEVITHWPQREKMSIFIEFSLSPDSSISKPLVPSQNQSFWQGLVHLKILVPEGDEKLTMNKSLQVVTMTWQWQQYDIVLIIIIPLGCSGWWWWWSGASEWQRLFKQVEMFAHLSHSLSLRRRRRRRRRSQRRTTLRRTRTRVRLMYYVTTNKHACETLRTPHILSGQGQPPTSQWGEYINSTFWDTSRHGEVFVEIGGFPT